MSNRRRFVQLWSVPGFEPEAIGTVAQIVTGQTRIAVMKNSTLRLDTCALMSDDSRWGQTTDAWSTEMFMCDH